MTTVMKSIRHRPPLAPSLSLSLSLSLVSRTSSLTMSTAVSKMYCEYVQCPSYFREQPAVPLILLLPRIVGFAHFPTKCCRSVPHKYTSICQTESFTSLISSPDDLQFCPTICFCLLTVSLPSRTPALLVSTKSHKSG